MFFLTSCAPTTTIPQPPTSEPIPTTPAQAETATPKPTAVTAPTPAPSPSARPNCVDSALFVADVTVSDNTKLNAGQSFTKTWQLRNTGTCPWDAGYSLVFTGGSRMGSPDSVSLAETAPNATLNLSVDLAAPTADGAYTGLYEIHNPQGQPIPIGLAKSMWVKIMVGNVLLVQATQTTTYSLNPSPTGTIIDNPTSPATGVCQPEQYTTELEALINAARASDGLPHLNVNAKLASAAQRHSDDMACNSIFSHTGSNGSSIYDRIAAAGYSPSNWGEIIYAGGSAQQAFDWWMNDPPHRDVILDPNMVHFGVGYSYLAGSDYGGYFTVDFGVN